LDDKGEKMTVNTPAWEKAWSTFAKLVNDKVIPSAKDGFNGNMMDGGKYDPLQGDKFLSGNVAMTISDYNYINDLIDANKNASKIKNFEKVDWDVVTLPTFPEEPGIGGNIYLNNIMGINAKAQNDKDAWDFIKFLNSEEWAKLKSRSSYEIVSRKKYIQPKDGLNYNIAAFYTLKPVPPNNADMDSMYRMNNFWQVQDKGREIFQTVLEGKKTSAEGLKEWEQKGNELLLQMKKNQKKPVTDGTVDNNTKTEAVPAG
jgi:multiple sugar transport system substrate-binding protein